MSASSKHQEKRLRLLALAKERAGTTLDTDRVMSKLCRCRLCLTLGGVPGVCHPEDEVADTATQPEPVLPPDTTEASVSAPDLTPEEKRERNRKKKIMAKRRAARRRAEGEPVRSERAQASRAAAKRRNKQRAASRRRTERRVEQLLHDEQAPASNSRLAYSTSTGREEAS